MESKQRSILDLGQASFGLEELGLLKIENNYLVEKNLLLDRLATDGALTEPVPTQLARPMATQEDHVLEAVHTHWAACLK